MTAYYNEIDPFAAQWLRELIKAGHIAPGEVDERSIEDVIPSELVGFTQCHFFAGIGVWSHALRQAGWHDDRPVWTGSCPCQPFSAAGKGLGLADERNLWPAFEWLIRQCRPDTIFGEQVESAIKHDWLDHVALSLEDCGYTVGAIGFPACSVGAPHKRQRLFWVASSNSNNNRYAPISVKFGRTYKKWSQHEFERLVENEIQLSVRTGKFGALSYGDSLRVGKVRCYTNAIVAPQAEAFIRAFMDLNLIK